jgi:hypothetical protein
MTLFARITQLVLLFAVLSLPQISAAQTEVTIQDTSGFVRAVGDVGTSGKVEFALINDQSQPAEDVEVKLTNTATGQVVTGRSVNGIVVFQNLAPGIWTVSTSTPGITFTNVAVVPESSTLIAGQLMNQVGPPLLGLGAVGGGTIALIEATDDDDDEPLSPAS